MGRQNLVDAVKFIDSGETAGLFRYNLMTKDIELTRESMLGGKRQLNDNDLVDLKFYISKIYNHEYPKSIIEEAAYIVSKRVAYNPLVDFLEDLVWDKVPRLDTWLIDACGADDNIYIRDVGRKILCGAVARAFNPGTKFDYMLILEGKQGIGKSTLVEILGGKWYLDTHLSSSEAKKDLIDIMSTAWIMEISDLAGFKRNDIEFLKSFISRKVDKVRLPYARRSDYFPRQCIIIGTHNPSGNNEYFTDDTGNRRFWCVECNHIDIEFIEKARNQLLAEAIIKLGEGEKLYLNHTESIEILENMQHSRETSTPLYSMIADYVKVRKEVSTLEILKDVFQINLGSVRAPDLKGKQTLIGIWMRKNGWKRGDNHEKGIYYRPELITGLRGHPEAESIDKLQNKISLDEINWEDD